MKISYQASAANDAWRWLKRGFEPLQGLFEPRRGGLGFGFPLALLLDHMLGRAGDEFLVGELGVELR